LAPTISSITSAGNAPVSPPSFVQGEFAMCTSRNAWLAWLQTIAPAAALVAAPSALLRAQGPPNPQPTDAHKVFAADAGTWDADIKMYHQGPSGPAAESKGVETNELVSGGLYLQTTFKGKMAERDFEGHGLFGYDSRTKEYTGLWVDNFTTIPSQLKGKYDAAAKTLTMYGVVVDGAGNEMRQKQVTKYPDERTKRFEIFLLIGEGDAAQEVKIMEMTLKKRA
jgi:hypothetical protein